MPTMHWPPMSTVPNAATPGPGLSSRSSASYGAWTFGVNVDPGHAPTDVVLQIGHGPASKPVFTSSLDAGQGIADVGSISITTSDLPEVSTVCVRFVATNSAGKAASAPLCFPRDGHS